MAEPRYDKADFFLGLMHERQGAGATIGHIVTRQDVNAGHRCRIIIADKNPVVRAGLSDFLGREDRFDVVDALADGAKFVSFCERGGADIGIIGWSLPDMTGCDVLDIVRRRQLPVRIIVYTNDADPAVLRDSVKGGAWGFALKSDDPELLVDTVNSVSRGRLSLPYVDIKTLVDDPLDVLTTRERELLRALANGLTNEQIAARIGISHNTVKYHLKNLYDKLQVKNRAMAVALYMSLPATAR